MSRSHKLLFIFMGSVLGMAAIGWAYSALAFKTEHAFYYRDEVLTRDHGFGFLDFFYFSVVTWTGGGYGDITPDNVYTRALTALEALCGIAVFVFAVAMATIHDHVGAKSGNRHRNSKKPG